LCVEKRRKEKKRKTSFLKKRQNLKTFNNLWPGTVTMTGKDSPKPGIA
jgi:hypothetical protein